MQLCNKERYTVTFFIYHDDSFVLSFCIFSVLFIILYINTKRLKNTNDTSRTTFVKVF